MLAMYQDGSASVISYTMNNFKGDSYVFDSGDDMKVLENDAEWQFVTLGDQVS